ncbi:MAG: hypothetical protein ACI85Q_000617 [Salibacteraceae bacterium]|jgi:hypothetical protein
MALTQGQLYFASFFLSLFILAMVFAYRSDLKQLGPHSQGALKVLVLIVFVMTIFFGTVKFLAS